MPWLLRDDEVLAALEVASSLRREPFDGALLVEPARTVNTMGMPGPIDVAYCRRDGSGTLVVVATARMARRRIGRPRPGAVCVIAAAAGAFERWGLRVGDELVVR
jgi:hypothetical protein